MPRVEPLDYFELTDDAPTQWREMLAGLVDQLRQERCRLEPPYELPPALATLADKKQPERARVFLAMHGRRAAGLCAMVPQGARELELQGVFVPGEFRGDHPGMKLIGLTDSQSFYARRPVRTVNLAHQMEGLTETLQAYGFEEAGIGIWHRNEEAAWYRWLDEMYAECLKWGRGDWSVVLHNDEHTTMVAVIDALKSTVDISEELAAMAMRLIHLSGSAPVWRCRRESRAESIAEHLRRRFQQLGFEPRVTVEPSSAPRALQLLPAA